MDRSIVASAAALAFTLLLGQISDKTTGQPLRGVGISLTQGRTMLRTTSDADGRFRFSGVQPGRHTLHYASDDVPPQNLLLRVSGAKQELRITACSTTLDYSCAGPGGGG